MGFFGFNLVSVRFSGSQGLFEVHIGFVRFNEVRWGFWGSMGFYGFKGSFEVPMRPCEVQ